MAMDAANEENFKTKSLKEARRLIANFVSIVPRMQI